jgi:hypothetical protein
MNSYLKSTISILFLLLFTSFGHADSGRFQRILKLYSDPAYRASDRKFFVTGDYNSTSGDSVPKEQGLSEDNDAISIMKRTASNDFGVKGALLKGNESKTLRYDMRLGVKGNYACTSNVRSNTMIGNKDITQNTSLYEDLYIDLSGSYENYFNIGKIKHCFFGVDAASDADLSGDYNRLYENYKLSSNSTEVNKVKSIFLKEQITINPSIGWGKPVFATPVYRAFEIERALKEAGVLNGELSDITIVKIAQWIASEFSVTETKDRPRKYIFAALDTILCKDSSVNEYPQTSFTVMNVIEKHDNTFPFLFDGFKISFLAAVKFPSVYEYYRYSYSSLDPKYNYGSYDGYGGYSEYQCDFPALYIQWGKALSSHFFFTFNALSNKMFCFYDNIGEDSKLSENHQKYLTTGFSFYYLVNDRVFFDAGLSDSAIRFDTKLKQPNLIWLSCHYFIEEKIGLDLSFTHGYADNSGKQSYYEASTKTITDKIKLELSYEF